jgi:ABC-2 type transport system permease protein
VENFLALEFLSIIWPIIAITIAIGLSQSNFAKEIETGSIIVLLSQPLKRWQIFLSKYLTMILLLSIFIIITIMSMVPATLVFDLQPTLDIYPYLLLLSFLFGLFFMSFATAVSVSVAGAGRVTAVGIGLATITYGLNVVSNLEESLEFLKYLSPFYYFDYSYVINEVGIELESVLVFSIMIIFFSCLAFVSFTNRDYS